MRLIVATRQLGFGGGVETHLQAVLPLLHDRGHTLAILHEHPAIDGAQLLLDGGPPIRRFSAAGRSVDAVLDDVDAFAPDWIYNHGLDSPDLEAGLTRRFACLLYAHNYYGICISGTRCHSGQDILPCQRAFGLACLAVYLPKHCGGRNPWTMLQRYRIEARRHQTLRRYAAILVASRYVASQFERCGIHPRMIHTVPLFPPGVVPTPQPPASRPFTGRVLFLGRITAQKGLDHLATALVEAQTSLGRPLQLVVAGDGPNRDAMLARARQCGLATEALGWISAAQRNDLMAGIDLLAVPSTWPEPFGLVGLEAGCLGVPSVAYATGGIPDWLRPGISGELATESPPRPPDLARAILRALQDPAHWQALREGAWRQSHNWSPEAHLACFLKVVEQALPARPRSQGSSPPNTTATLSKKWIAD